MKEKIKIIKKIGIFGGILFVTAAVCFFAGNHWKNKKSEPVLSNSVLEQKLQTINELATVSYQYTNMGKFEEQTDFYGWKVPLTKKSFIVAYDGMIKAGVDMSESTVTSNQNTIEITLPKAKILSHSIDDHSIEVFDETKNIFNPISLTDYTGFSIDQKGKMEEKAIQSGLLEQAEKQAEEAITQLLSFTQDPNSEVQFLIQFNQPIE